MMRLLAIALLATLPSLGIAQSKAPTPMPTPSPAIASAPDPAWKVPQVLAFIGVKPGDRVADIVAGRLTASLAAAVGPRGKVYAVEPAEVVKVHPDVITTMGGLASRSPNVIVTTGPIATPLPGGLDIVFIRQNYHDLYDKFMGPADVAAFDRAVFAALKPGGVFVVLDHAAAAGSGIGATETLHRIDPARVKADALAAGFTLAGESDILANPADDHSALVFAPQIRGRTDQFLLKFRKPR